VSSLRIDNALLDGAPVRVTIREGVIASVEPAATAARLGRAPAAGVEDVPAAGGEAAANAGVEAGGAVDRVIDATGLHLFPGLRNGHTHAAMTLFRGWGDDMDLMPWLETRIWPAEARLTEEDVYAGTRLALLEMIRSGTTFLNDMYWFPAGIARAVEEMGMRALLGACFIDLDLDDMSTKWRAETEAAIELSTGWGLRLGLTMAPHAIYSVRAENLRWMGDLAREHGLLFHIHLSETAGEVERCVAAHGMRPTHYLDSLGLVAPNLVAAHGTYLDPSELELLGAAGAAVVHNPIANLKLATGGILDYPTAREAGVRVVLGTDGTASNNNLDLIEEMKFAALVQKHRAVDSKVLPAPEALEMCTSVAAGVFGQGSGAVAAGEVADLILVDFSAPSTQPLHDPVSQLVYAAHGDAVHTTICDGRVLMHDRVVEVVDEGEVVAGAVEAARRVVG
jgi:5-methylthioadenosine/S-adenosylhomocysteine deaminase